jgi:hypothetical protein
MVWKLQIILMKTNPYNLASRFQIIFNDTARLLISGIKYILTNSLHQWSILKINFLELGTVINQVSCNREAQQGCSCAEHVCIQIKHLQGRKFPSEDDWHPSEGIYKGHKGRISMEIKRTVCVIVHLEQCFINKCLPRILNVSWPDGK